MPVTLPIVSYESLALLQLWFVENVKHHMYNNMQMCYINFTEIYHLTNVCICEFYHDLWSKCCFMIYIDLYYSVQDLQKFQTTLIVNGHTWSIIIEQFND